MGPPCAQDDHRIPPHSKQSAYQIAIQSNGQNDDDQDGDDNDNEDDDAANDEHVIITLGNNGQVVCTSLATVIKAIKIQYEETNRNKVMDVTA